MILDEIIEKKKKRIEEVKRDIPFEIIKERALKMGIEKDNKFYNAISQQGLSVIGEIKNASPSTGPLQVQLSLEDRVDKYTNAVDAISVLTEEDYFNGSVTILESVRKRTRTPILRKDFIVDTYQIYEARTIGSDAILLIAAALHLDELIMFNVLARSLNLEVLLEVHDEEDLDKALLTNNRIIGINNRNLKDFSISLETTKRLRPLIPNDRLVVSESGISTIRDIEYLKTLNINGILVGRSLMETENPDQLVKEWKEHFES
ncbi:indole-3-glycerol phosphate synthase [Natranaerovirga pectinivora]|uniref:Indole-3-glycerol phosphate synthase n=1 Tax=Natranaerovirga pectinivora TaxID=682400 RepID=A0A4R3MQL6_9FIRM|nr:indole-3-glycerol phosphate synthase TrpC [Natranaerovirga pectinivora]TCT17084.1 indole-3-glycerol phosphate synthase [Natranaerovirga pectinivora]